MTESTETSRARLEAALERETALREAAQRRAESLGQDHEDAYERLLVRCRSLQDDKRRWSAEALRWSAETLRWSEERDGLLAAGEAQAARIATLTERLAEAEAARERREQEHRDALEAQARALDRSHRAERERLAAAQNQALSEAEDRFHEARRELAEAEKSFRIEAHRLSALLALKAREAEEKAAEAAALRDQLALTLGSRSWKMGRPFRVLTRVLRRAAPAPRRLGRILGPRP